jgi:hypothetical protein
MFSRNVIRKRVMAVIDNHIKSAEEKLESGCREID